MGLPIKSLQSVLHTNDLSLDEISLLFEKTRLLKSRFIESREWSFRRPGFQVGMFFAEASTRTKLSFQMAVQRMGGQCLFIDASPSSSVSKGETLDDTFWTLHGMNPDLIIVRCNDTLNLKMLAARSQCPIISAGMGSESHPTQAWVDWVSLLEARAETDFLSLAPREKFLFVGDIRHSRVVASHWRLLKSLGAEIGFCGPEEFLPKERSGVKIFSKLESGVSWCSVYYGLRVQTERHRESQTFPDRINYSKEFGLDEQKLKNLSRSALIMHPGPVNWGVEMSRSVAEDPRFIMWKQKENGVYLRSALLEMISQGRLA